MKKNLFTLLILFISTLTYSQNQKATTEDGRTVILKADNTWEYTSKEDSQDGCDLGNDFKEGKVDKKLRKHVAVDNNCKEEDVIFISSSTGMGRGLYVLCVKGKLMKYKKVGTVFMRDGDNPWEEKN